MCPTEEEGTEAMDTGVRKTWCIQRTTNGSMFEECYRRDKEWLEKKQDRKTEAWS